MVELARKRVVQCPDLLDVNAPHVLTHFFCRSDEMRAVGFAMSPLAVLSCVLIGWRRIQALFRILIILDAKCMLNGPDVCDR